ncbi:hypothetical protein J2S90_000201 [Arthrobacter bambusae]|uniref:Uncharacterized protein n=1 Tax=Arthrobacter bambusae TaxID=1338426 RepID=A0AAW8DBF3_9MICC|nr:hypothetical protein [Arthrobacter bambusae]MDQ0128745.1 hypothetical protein [Arthrobacter bambusae]MDQ0180086.1 hypothetical protein [Arthrobacter bambusae]
MSERLGRDVPAEQISEELPEVSSSPEVSSNAETWSIALPDSVYLRASPHLEHEPPAWLGSTLRRWMRLVCIALTPEGETWTRETLVGLETEASGIVCGDRDCARSRVMDHPCSGCRE